MVALALDVVVVEELDAKVLNLLTTNVPRHYQVLGVSDAVHSHAIRRLHGNERQKVASLSGNNDCCDEDNYDTHDHAEQCCRIDITVTNSKQSDNDKVQRVQECQRGVAVLVDNLKFA